MSYQLAIDFLAANPFVVVALTSMCLVAYVIAKPTAAFGGVLVTAALVGAASAAAAPANTGTIPLQLIEVKSPVARGDDGSLVAIVFPDRPRCTIIVDYKHDPADAQGLNPKRPAPGGRLAWKWKVGADATVGRWPIRVNCGTLGSLRTHFTIVR
ncbi:MAG TPA: hypothetical protein VGP69_18995 [Gaiellaceae bacterium]|jgi:hypothetical protein|nr:hypothetical protein [Gaiellaceae bacterium]